MILLTLILICIAIICIAILRQRPLALLLAVVALIMICTGWHGALH